MPFWKFFISRTHLFGTKLRFYKFSTIFGFLNWLFIFCSERKPGKAVDFWTFRSFQFFFKWGLEDYGKIWYINYFTSLTSNSTLTNLFLPTIILFNLCCFLLSKSLSPFKFLSSYKAAGLVVFYKISSYLSISPH